MSLVGVAPSIHFDTADLAVTVVTRNVRKILLYVDVHGETWIISLIM